MRFLYDLVLLYFLNEFGMEKVIKKKKKEMGEKLVTHREKSLNQSIDVD